MTKFIVLFDGVCNLCNNSVRFIIDRDPSARFQFASLQSPQAQELLKNYQLENGYSDSMVLIQGSHIYTASTAALRIVRRLSGLWPLLTIFILIPRPIRDWFYSILVRNRYRWFGRSDACMRPTPALRQRFLE